MTVQDQSQSQAESDVQQLSVDGAAVTDEAEAAATDRHPDGPSLDIVFEILKNSRRREVIRHLRERDEQVSLGELAEHIAAIENETTTDALTSSQRKRVYVGLYQCHLPKMDDVGVVHFNQDRGHVTLTEQASLFEEYLDAPESGQSVRWYRYYSAVSLLGAVGLVLSILLSPPSWIVLTLLAGIVGLATACSIQHLLAESNMQD